jgi:hypothetical protein
MTGIFGNPDHSYTWEVLANTDMKATSWWLGFFQQTILSKIAVALQCMPITSAANERNWSERGNIHTPVRNWLVLFFIIEQI